VRKGDRGKNNSKVPLEDLVALREMSSGGDQVIGGGGGGNKSPGQDVGHCLPPMGEGADRAPTQKKVLSSAIKKKEHAV